jgi:hypothetical protein
MENEKLNFDEMMEFYLSNNQDGKIEDEEKVNNDKSYIFKENQGIEKNHSINDESNINDNTNFDSVSIIVSEKNQLIEEMKNYITRLKEKYDEELSNKNKEVYSYIKIYYIFALN